MPHRNRLNSFLQARQTLMLAARRYARVTNDLHAGKVSLGTVTDASEALELAAMVFAQAQLVSKKSANDT